MFKGKFMNSQRITAVLFLAMGLAVSNSVWSAQAGRVQFVNGDVELTTAAGVTHAAHKGDPVNEGDTITSAKAASAQIKMQDGGFIAVRPDTKLKFDSFQFSGKEGEPENSFFSLFKGGFRAVTGLIGRIRKEDYHITTPVATIGIRGTDHETVMVLADNPLVAAGLAAPGAYNKVNLGETSITTDKGTINVLPNQMGFAGGMNQMPKIQPINTGLFTVAPQASPGAKMDSGKGGEQQARDTAVVDTTAQAATGGNTANTTGVGSASTLFSIAPPTVVITPETVLGIVTAPFVNTDIVYDVAGTFGTPNMGIGATSNISSTSGSAFFNYHNSGCSGTCTLTETLTLSGGTSVTAGSATTGAAWGYWTGANSATQTITTNISTTTTTTTTPGIISWITAPSNSPFYLPSVLQGTMTYNLLGGVATDGTNLGTVNSASLTVNFSSQLVDLALNATVNGLTWVVTGTGAPLRGGGNGPGHAIFDFNFSCTGCNTGSLSATIGAGYLTSGNVSGALTGNGLTGAILSYALTSVTGSSISGVAALGLSPSTPINTATPYQIALSSFPIMPATLPYPNSTSPYAVIQDTVNGSIFNPSTLVLDAAGNPVQWQESNNSSGGLLLGLTLLPGAQTVAISGSTAVDIGKDPVSGIKWGRWSGGTISFTPVAGGNAQSTNMPAGGLHWIGTPSATSPVSLPVSGTYNYVLAGGTRPTDHLGNVGTLNSASLTANFSAMTVNTAVNVTVANTTFNGSATGLPILQGAVFQVGSGNNTSYGTLTCSGTGCGAVNAGQAIGVFTQAGLGAAVTYGFQTGPSLGSPTSVVGGVVAFHR